MKSFVLFSLLSAILISLVAAQFENTIAIVTRTTDIVVDNNSVYPPVTMTITEMSTTTVFPRYTNIASSTITPTISNDASRLFTMKSSQLAAIVVLTYLVFLL
ncbi:hypothetical protein [Parasitella parasitica]|uniref:Uncharacterized protein n=1 Tax=Parasitella parasitica TaxID=35722 RepID=A0A0B7NKK9_9FUNG|nr:hypothetical protein [Parasitella parasitica]